MVSYIITVKSSNQIQPSNTYINPIQIEYDNDFSRWEKAGQTYYWIPLKDVPMCD